MELAGRAALVTGASGGIGQAIVRALHARGASLVVSARRGDVLEELRESLGGERVEPAVADLSDREDVVRLAERCAEVDVLVANAALPASGRVDDFSPEEIDRALEVNLRAPMVLTRLLAPRMAERGRGHIVFVSSLGGKSAQRGSSVYSATKFGLRGFGQGLRADLRPDGVGVSVVFPGFVRDAGMFHESGAKLPKGVGTSTPDDVAGAVLSAIRRNRGEVDVAPASLRAGTAFAQLAPDAAAKVARRLGSDGIADDMAAGQAVKR